MAANARGGAVHTATRRRTYRNAYNYVTLSAFLDLASHCHSTSSVPRRCARARVAVPTTRGCALRAEWQCRPRGAARSGSSGSAAHTATRRRAYGQHALTLPLDVERTEDVALPPGDLAHAEAVVLLRVVPGHPRLVEEVPGAWSLSSRPARPPALPRRWYERDKHDKGLADQGSLGGHARRAETGQPPGAAEAPLDCVPVAAGRQRLAGSMTSSENVPLPRRRGLAGRRQARGGPLGPAPLQDRLARRDGSLRARGRERDPGRPRRPQGPEHDRKIDRFQGA